MRLFRLTFRINIDGGTKSKINKSHSQWEYLYAVGKTSDTVATHKDGYRKFDGKIGIFEISLKNSQRPESDISEAVKSAKRDRMADFSRK